MDLGTQTRAYLFAVTRRILRCEDAASDATQDALLLAHRFRDSFRGESTPRTWLHRIAVTTALQHLRKRTRSREHLAATGTLPELVDPAPSPEHQAATREVAARAAEVLVAIDAAHRDVFVMRILDCPDSEIAQRLGISIPNVKIRTHRARHRLRACLESA
jgi:RNA polymerase sigma-70 factor (ECF subfamily)